MARLPLFPLGTVLIPGHPLPLHVFETRYRRMVQELLELPEGERRFGVVAISAGVEVRAAENELYDVGCIAELRRVVPLPDGRSELLAVGVGRFRLLSAESESDGLAVGEITELEEVTGPQDSLLAARVRESFRQYVRALLATRGVEPDADPELPHDPLTLSFAVAGAAVLSVPDRQRLLAAASVTERLTAEVEMLSRETALARSLAAGPGTDLAHTPYSSN